MLSICQATTQEQQHPPLPELSTLPSSSNESTKERDQAVIDFIHDSYPSLEEIHDKSDPRAKTTLGWKLLHPDSRGKHDRAHRAARKNRLAAAAHNIISLSRCSYCNATGYNTVLFTPGGTCTACGTVDSEFVPLLDTSIISYNHTMLADAVRYDPRFYIKERLNNWRGVCPATPNENMREIILGVIGEIGRPSGFSARSISRSLIYDVINKLYGSSALRTMDEWRGSRKCLVYRERWLSIKRWMCQNHQVFQIHDAEEWLDRFDRYAPCDTLIDRLERMMRVLEQSFKELLYSERKDGIKRHNRPRRDVSILFLLYGLHPALVAIYGTDYWKPPTTKKSRDENTLRFRVLLESARRRDPLNHWPSDTVTLETIMALESAEYISSECSDDIIELFPCEFEDRMVIHRKDCALY